MRTNGILWTMSLWVAAAVACTDVGPPGANGEQTADAGPEGTAIPPFDVPVGSPAGHDGGCGPEGGDRPADAGGSPRDATAPEGMDAAAAAPRFRPIGFTEIDYDQPGADTAELVEVHNAGKEPVSLDGWAVVLVNGADGDAYGRVALEGTLVAGAYAVIATEEVRVAAGALRFEASAGFLQNGPDAAVLVDAEGTVVDAVAYEGPVTWNGAADAGAAGLAIAPPAAEDDGEGSLVRVGSGTTAWEAAPEPSPGAPPGG